MKSRLFKVFAVLSLLVGTAAFVAPVHAVNPTGFIHSDNNGDNGNQ
jgi:hypothetical protein